MLRSSCDSTISEGSAGIYVTVERPTHNSRQSNLRTAGRRVVKAASRDDAESGSRRGIRDREWAAAGAKVPKYLEHKGTESVNERSYKRPAR